jgi:hypothetical protein
MLLSKNSFFKQPKEVLESKRQDVETLLKIKGFDSSIYLEAYNYFCENKLDFDGATIVKDLPDIPNLDLNAMVHDYRYILQFGVFRKFRWDWEYYQGMNDLGKGYRTGRFIVLLLSSIFFTPYKSLKN